MKKLIVCLLLLAGCSKNENPVNPNSATVTDIDGNVYHTVTIGTQVWMVENLKTTKYNDGTVIPLVADSVAWINLTMSGYCWYHDSITYKEPYGALYNWYAVRTGKLAPKGWHIPTDSEWTILTTYLGGDSIAGGNMKEAGLTHWNSPNTGATNSSGFTALPGGGRNLDGIFNSMVGYGGWWTSTEFSATDAWNRSLSSYKAVVYRCNYSKKDGFSVRCVRD